MIITKKKYDKAERRNVELARLLRETCKDNKELKQLRLQEVHNNTILVNKTRRLEQVVNRFEELSKEKHFNSAENLINKMKSILDDYHTNPTCK